MSVAALVTRNMQLSYFPHTDVTGDCWVMVKRGVTTANGAADGTTLIDTGGDSGGADTYSGRYWLRCTSGNNEDEQARIIDDDGAGTLTFEDTGFDDQVVSGTTYEIWQSPEPVVVVDSSSGETNMVDAVRIDEADDFWIGYYAVPISGTHRGKIALVTDFVKSTGTFTLASSFGTALGAGDVVTLRKFVEPGNLNDGTTKAFNEVLSDRLTGSRGDGFTGPRSGTLGFELKVTSHGAPASAGNAAPASVLSGLLPPCGFKEVIGSTSTIAAGSTTSNIVLDTAQWEQHQIGQMVIHNGMPAFVTASTDGAGSDDDVDVTPPFPVAPAAADLLYSARMYRKNVNQDDGPYRACGFELNIDGWRSTMTGCKGNVTFTDGEVPMLAFEFQVDHWIREALSVPYNAGSAYTTQRPVQTHDRLVWTNAGRRAIGGVGASLNNEVAAISQQGSNGINGTSGFAHVRDNAGVNYSQVLETTAPLNGTERWLKRGTLDVIITYGVGAGSIFAVRVPVARIVEDPRPTDQGGMQIVNLVNRAHDAGTATNGDGDLKKVPDFAIYLG